MIILAIAGIIAILSLVIALGVILKKRETYVSYGEMPDCGKTNFIGKPYSNCGSDYIKLDN